MNQHRIALLIVDPDRVADGAPEVSVKQVGLSADGSGADDVRLVLCSSLRTRFELERIQQRLGIREPFISENGGALFVPHGYFGREIPSARMVGGYETVEFGAPYAEVVKTLRRTVQRLRIDVTGFNDLTIEEVAERCGTSLLCASLAKLREYVEPVWVATSDPTARGRLQQALRTAGLAYTAVGGQGVVGGSVHVSAVLSLLMGLFRKANTEPVAYSYGWDNDLDRHGRARMARVGDRPWPPEVHSLLAAVQDSMTPS